MYRIGFFIVLVITVLALVKSVDARPRERFDQRTQMCRLLTRAPLDWASEPWGTGGIKFREVCKTCHRKDNTEGAPFLHAESYTPKAWNRIFYKRRKPCARNGSWDVLSDEEILLVNDYLYRNGDWTYDPNDSDSCG